MTPWLARLRALDSETHPESKISETSETLIGPARSADVGDSGDLGIGVETETELLQRGVRGSEAGPRLTAAEAKPRARRPAHPCGLCGTAAWTWPGMGRWLCSTCAERPAPSLTEVHASLTDAERAQLAAEAAGGDTLAQFVVEATACRPEPVAWRLYSRRLDRELWVARDIKEATELDRDGARNGLPVVLARDLERLRDFDDHRLTDLLDVLRHFPGARIAELDPEAAS
jgi:hypothetical protein